MGLKELWFWRKYSSIDKLGRSHFNKGYDIILIGVILMEVQHHNDVKRIVKFYIQMVLK